MAVTRIRPHVSEADSPADLSDDQAASETRHGVFAGLAAIVRHGDVRVLVGLYCPKCS